MHITAFRPNFNESRLPRLLLAALAATLLAGIAAGCGSNKTSTSTPAATSATAGSSTVNGVMKEYTIAPDKTVVSAGKVKFTITNKGKMVHEFIVVKTDLAQDKLPMANVPGQTNKVDEDSHALTFVGEIEHLKPGETDTKTFDLKPGNYVLFCNVAGHYGYGQHAALKVQ